MQKSFPFNSVNHDRKYKAEDWTEYFRTFIGNGVFPSPSDGLQVQAGNNMNVVVKAGKAWINGYFFFNTSDMAVTLDTSDGVLNRIDRIVVRWDLTTRDVTLQVKKGAYSASPSPLPLQRDADAYELALADVAVNKGVVSITQANITDQRLNMALCGVAAALINQIDTSAFNAQLQSWFEEYQKMSDAEYKALTAYFQAYKIRSDSEFRALQDWFLSYKETASNDFNAWFASIKNIFDEDTAGHLLNMITGVSERVEMIEQVIFNDITENPYLIQFDDLEGVSAKGVYNKELQRIEC